MGTLFSALSLANSGLQAAQIQMDVAGHNIANVNKEGFSRQRVSLTSRHPDYRSYGALGRGVEVSQIERIRDTFLDKVYRQQTPALGAAEIRASYFERIEDIFQEPGENGLGTRLNEFFDALNDFANNVEEQPVRQSVISEAETLASTLNEVQERIELLRTNANEEARNLVPEINSLTERIAALNVYIRDAEVGSGNPANDMRDERDTLLDELSRLVNISAQERADGQVDVTMSGEVLVEGDNTRKLVSEPNAALDPERGDLVEIRFEDTGLLADIQGGELHGALSIRDEDLVELDARLDTMAASIIQQVNRIHSQGNGLTNLSGTIRSTNTVDDATTALNAAGLPFTVSNGTFDLVLYDAAGTPTRHTLTVDGTTTLQSLANDLSAIPGFSATVASDGMTLELSATNPGATFSFASDTSGVLTALGVNGLFTGQDAKTIGVNQDIVDNPLWLTSAYSDTLAETGDNSAALDLANVRNVLALENNASSINDYYESTVVLVGVKSRSNADVQDVEQAFVDDFQKRRQEISGVSIDEEVTNLLLYQRAFEASARVITVTDRMLDALLNMI